jgi:hypothetical protein
MSLVLYMLCTLLVWLVPGDHLQGVARRLRSGCAENSGRTAARVHRRVVALARRDGQLILLVLLVLLVVEVYMLVEVGHMRWVHRLPGDVDR